MPKGYHSGKSSACVGCYYLERRTNESGFPLYCKLWVKYLRGGYKIPESNKCYKNKEDIK